MMNTILDGEPTNDPRNLNRSSLKKITFCVNSACICKSKHELTAFDLIQTFRDII